MDGVDITRAQVMALTGHQLVQLGGDEGKVSISGVICKVTTEGDRGAISRQVVRYDSNDVPTIVRVDTWGGSLDDYVGDWSVV